MGMYTEFYFRANIKDGPVADWLDSYINGDTEEPFDTSEFFQDDYWIMPFRGGGAVYQESRTPVFRRPASCGPYGNQLVLSSSMKHSKWIYLFIDWITPHLNMSDGDLLGYSLYEDSCHDNGDDYREHPTLYFHMRAPVDS